MTRTSSREHTRPRDIEQTGGHRAESLTPIVPFQPIHDIQSAHLLSAGGVLPTRHSPPLPNLRLDLLQVRVQVGIALDDSLDNLLDDCVLVRVDCLFDRLELGLCGGVDGGLRGGGMGRVLGLEGVTGVEKCKRVRADL